MNFLNLAVYEVERRNVFFFVYKNAARSQNLTKAVKSLLLSVFY